MENPVLVNPLPIPDVKVTFASSAFSDIGSGAVR